MSRATRRRLRPLDGIVLLDKPLGWSSNEALQQVRLLFRAEKAGHTGNLDPLATGLLPICLGQATKLSGHLLEGDKRYTATLRLGARTTTGDAEGEVIAVSDPGSLDASAIPAVLARFQGSVLQVPPMHSAIKRGGQPLYRLARGGLEVERTAREVSVYKLELLRRAADELVLDVHCSKGTYIRTLAEDIAAALGQHAHLSALRRTAAAPFEEGEMHSYEVLESARDVGESALEALLLPMASAVKGWAQVRVDTAQADILAHGQPLPLQPGPEGAEIAVLDPQGRLFGIAEVRAGQLWPRRWMAETNVACGGSLAGL